jgi:hypothetical protein
MTANLRRFVVTTPTDLATFEQLRQAMLDSLISPSDGRRYAVVSEILAVFPFDEVPQPGFVRGWSQRDWARWYEEHQFELQEQTAHSIQYRHARLRIISGYPSSPGDWRWSMNHASDLRRFIRDAFENWSIVLTATLRIIKLEAEPQQVLRAFVQPLIEQPELLAAALADAADRSRADHNALGSVVSVREVRSVLNKLESEFQLSYRASLHHLKFLKDESVESLVLLAKSHNSDVSVASCVVSGLRDLLELRRTLATAEREHKQAERDRERAEREAARTLATTPSGQLQTKITQVRNALISNHANAMRQLVEATTRFEHLGNAVRELEIPIPLDFDGAAGAAARVAELEAEVAAHETEIAQQQTTIAELRVIAKERDELLATPDVRVAFDRFLADAERLLQEDNFMRLAGNIAKLLARITQERAALALPTTKDIGGASVATSAGT